MSDELIDIGPVPSWLIIDGFRYAISRTSSQPETTARWLVGVWPRLDDVTRVIIRHDLERAFRCDDAARSRGETHYLLLGWDRDRHSWEMVRALWTEAPHS